MTDIANINAFKRIDVLLKNFLSNEVKKYNLRKKRIKRMYNFSNLHDNCMKVCENEIKFRKPANLPLVISFTFVDILKLNIKNS